MNMTMELTSTALLSATSEDSCRELVVAELSRSDEVLLTTGQRQAALIPIISHPNASTTSFFFTPKHAIPYGDRLLVALQPVDDLLAQNVLHLDAFLPIVTVQDSPPVVQIHPSARHDDDL
ncbi:hypothetical protein AC1031_014628 [Aphanomyces cochlioides]|nr:hypothetical protein AC1031_014628 [Aphanomyces cochlioides]